MLTMSARTIACFLLIAAAAIAQPSFESPSTQPTAEPTTRRASSNAVVITLEGTVNDFNQQMLSKRLDQARTQADTIILKINTWGGSALSAIEISQLLKRQENVHIIAFVEQKAISAGALIALACDEIVMQPGSMIGDCAPIVPGQQLEKTERAKAEGPILAEFADSAQQNGYDPLLVSAMVSVGRVVHYVENAAGERKFVDADDYAKLTKDGEWKPVAGLPDPVDGDDSLLTVHAGDALKLGLSKATISSVQSLAAERNLTIVDTLEHSTGERLIDFLSGDVVRGLLSVIFLLSIYAAFQTPGHGAPEAIALTAGALLLGVPVLTGYANWVEILMIVLGIGLLAAELFVIPGFGFAGITGLCLLLGGILLTFVPAEPKFPGWLPSLSGTYQSLWSGVVVLTIALAVTLVLGAWLNRFLPKVPMFGKLVLNTAVGTESEVNYAAVIDEPAWPEVGAVGRALTDLVPGGTAAFADEISQELQTTNVVSDSGFIAANTQIVVREVHGNRVVVRATDSA